MKQRAETNSARAALRLADMFADARPAALAVVYLVYKATLLIRSVCLVLL